MPDTSIAIVASSTAAVSTPITPPPESPSGLQAVVAAGMAILGVITALFPNTPIVEALTTTIPQLKIAVPLVLTSVGSIWATISHPPSVPKR